MSRDARCVTETTRELHFSAWKREKAHTEKNKKYISQRLVNFPDATLASAVRSLATETFPHGWLSFISPVDVRSQPGSFYLPPLSPLISTLSLSTPLRPDAWAEREWAPVKVTWSGRMHCVHVRSNAHCCCWSTRTNLLIEQNTRLEAAAAAAAAAVGHLLILIFVQLASHMQPHLSHRLLTLLLYNKQPSRQSGG